MFFNKTATHSGGRSFFSGRFLQKYTDRYIFVFLHQTNIPTMSKAERTRRYIIEKTAPVFNRKGYAGTSLTDISQVTGLTKGSIYGNFGNKDEVARAVFEYNTGLLVEGLDHHLKRKASAGEKLLGFVDFYRRNWKTVFDNGGCPLLNAATEADDNLPYLREDVQHCFRVWTNRVSSIIDEGKKTREFKSVPTREYAQLFIAMIEGGIGVAKITDNRRPLMLVLDRIEKIIRDEIFADPGYCR